MNKVPAHRAAKLSDVARRAGVSTATVSRALTLPHKVQKRTLARIEAAVKALGYVAHGAARALASKRTHTIGAVIPTLDNAIFANTTHALQKTLDEAGYTLLLACHEFDAEVEVRVTRALITRGIDGLVLLGTMHHPEVFRLIAGHHLPYVLSWALDKAGRHPCVGFDNRAAATRVAQYLLGLGHRRFAMISGITANNERARERRDGMREALATHGIDVQAVPIVEEPFTLSAGRSGLAQVIGGVRPPTAIICGNDILAIGAIAECHARGLRVPEDVSVTGFDDMEIAALFTPSLTTVRFPTRELGSLAAAYLLARLAGKSIPAKRELPVELVVRDSTASPASERRTAVG